MKVAVCSQGNSPTYNVDPRFARSANFIVFDKDGTWISLENPALSAEHGAATAVVQELVYKDVDVVLAANIGPNALAALNAAGISVHSISADKTVQEAYRSYIESTASTKE